MKTRPPLFALLPLLLLATPLAAAPFEPKPSRIPPAEIAATVRKALACVRGAGLTGKTTKDDTIDAFILYALFHAGVPKEDAGFQAYLKRVVDAPPQKTYSTALAAMCLSELDPDGYRWKLEQYATFLVNTQCGNGQWSYGGTVDLPAPPPEGPGRVASGPGASAASLYGTRPAGGNASRGGNTAARKIVRQTGRGPKTGDNSNAQYAALGLRACAEAGLFPDPRCVRDARLWWATSQNPDGGWGYQEGFCGFSYGSMTAGGVCAVAIYDWMEGKQCKSDPVVVRGVQWLNAHWAVAENPAGKGQEHWLYYYLYALERVGMVVGINAIGAHDWYDEGARSLIKSQEADGSWKSPMRGPAHYGVYNACFAILFLRKATKPLVYTH